MILCVYFLSEPKLALLHMKVLIQISMSYTYIGHGVSIGNKRWGAVGLERTSCLAAGLVGNVDVDEFLQVYVAWWQLCVCPMYFYWDSSYSWEAMIDFLLLLIFWLPLYLCLFCACGSFSVFLSFHQKPYFLWYRCLSPGSIKICLSVHLLTCFLICRKKSC